MKVGVTAASLLGTLVAASAPAPAIDAETQRLGRQVADRAIAYLRAQQDGSTGGWSHSDEGRPNFPAISGLVLTGMLLDPRIDQTDPAVVRGVEYVLSYRKPDGSIHDSALPTYNTAICLSALALVRTPEAASAILGGQGFLRSAQFSESYDGSAESPDLTEPIGRDHPYYGGVGYGRSGRPDVSNTGFFLQALHDTGVSSDDPAVQKALVFLSRVQMLDETNDMPYADGSSQGGFIYATVPDKDSVEGRAGQSFAGETTETTEDGRSIVRLRAYGSMSYVGFKSLIFANLDRDDPRVTAVRGWLEQHFTLDENPGMGDQGRYYYYLAMSRALDAWGEPEIAGTDWRPALIATLAELQNEDGSFRPLNDRWMESDPVLITAYSLIAVQEALGND
jgi:squalene-hopene/tetraprenyl-beta-curcumene cyclase